MLVKCLYCDVDNDALATGGFCESCGKKLPAAAMVKPRRTLGGDTPDEPSEKSPLPPRSKAVSEGLFATAILYLFAGGAFFILAGMLYGSSTPDRYGPTVVTWTVLPALVVGVLGLLARWMPMPAVGVALILAMAWAAATFVLHAPLALGWIAVDLVLFALLGWSLWRGLQPEKASGR